MRIGLILAKPPGYTETFFNSKIKGLQKKGFQVSLYCQEGRKDFNLCKTYIRPQLTGNPFLQLIYMLYHYLRLFGSIPQVYRFYKLEKKEGTKISVIAKRIYLNAHILKGREDWLHYGFGTLALERELLAQAIGARMAVSFRGFDMEIYPLKYPGCYRLLWEKVDKIHFISNYLRNKALELGLPAGKEYKVISPALDYQEFPSKNIEVRDNNRQKIKIVTVARLHWIKGIDLLIHTARILKEKKIPFEWIVIGDGIQKEVERYEFHVLEEELTEELHLLGKLSHAGTLEEIDKADLYVQTSLNEGFCNALLEAQALGRLCISTNTGGQSENILDGVTGWLVSGLDPNNLANKIQEVMKMEPEVKKEISEAARSRAIKDFNIEQQQLAFAEFYKS